MLGCFDGVWSSLDRIYDSCDGIREYVDGISGSFDEMQAAFDRMHDSSDEIWGFSDRNLGIFWQKFEDFLIECRAFFDISISISSMSRKEPYIQYTYGVALINRIDTMIGLFCKRGL